MIGRDNGVLTCDWLLFPAQLKHNTIDGRNAARAGGRARRRRRERHRALQRRNRRRLHHPLRHRRHRLRRVASGI